MKLREAKKLITERRTTGYIVAFEWRIGRMLEPDHFPDYESGEPMISTEEEAVTLAQQFAAALAGEVTNVRVVLRELATMRD